MQTLIAPETKTKPDQKPVWPRFSGSLTLYLVAVLVSGICTGGEPGRIILLVSSVFLFGLFWLISRYSAKWFYWSGLGLVGGITIVGLLTLPRLDDDYLRANNISQKVISTIQCFAPDLNWLAMHRNSLAGLLAVFAVVALAYGLAGTFLWARVAGGLAGLVMLCTLLVTNSRGGLVAFAFGLLLLGLLGWSGYSRKTRLGLTGIALVLFILALAYLLVSGQYRLFNPERLLSENGYSRVEIWQNVVYLLGDVPLTGLGPGHFKEFYPFYLDPASLAGGNYQEHAHNLFLQSYAELGLAGFIAVGWAALSWAILCWQVIRGKLKTTQLSAAPLFGGLAAFGVWLVYGLTEHSTWNGVFTPFFWLPAALIAGACPPLLAFSFLKFNIAKPQLSFRAGLFGLPGLGLAGLIIWQFLGLATLNAASLEKLKAWQAGSPVAFERAEQLYQLTEASVGWTGVPYRGEAWLAFQQNQTIKAEASLRQVLQYDPADKRSLLLLGDLLSQDGHPTEALDLWRKAKAAPLFVWRGRHWLDSNNDLPAEPYFKNAIAIDPYLWDGYAFLSMLYQRHGRTAEARTLMEQAARLLPSDPRPAAELARLQS